MRSNLISLHPINVRISGHVVIQCIVYVCLPRLSILYLFSEILMEDIVFSFLGFIKTHLLTCLC
jgi:branched-subunit amino acid transport protein